MYLIDSHCHLNIIKKKYTDNIKDILQQASNNDVKLILNVATSIDYYIESSQLFKNNKYILHSCGIHPLDESIYHTNNINKLEDSIINNNNITALGETGLDFYYTNTTKNIQIDAFKQHIYLSIKYNIPIIIHTRNANKDTINILSNQESLSCSGVVHSFTGDINMARKLLDLGLYISLSGIITFKNALHIKNMAKFIPVNRLLIETDSPYLSPEPYRGQYNKPSNLLYIAKYLAQLKQISVTDITRIIKKNFYSLFSLSK
ncbi:TatD family hydrolase [Buchnera aphidicola (Takecallis taiwana)]|uniref:TatD family hydrolase n=1 Tax=Buchnera aphidicola TaxID=9 RepID=UPI0031B6C7D3